MVSSDAGGVKYAIFKGFRDEWVTADLTQGNGSVDIHSCYTNIVRCVLRALLLPYFEVVTVCAFCGNKFMQLGLCQGFVNYVGIKLSGRILVLKKSDELYML